LGGVEILKFVNTGWRRQNQTKLPNQMNKT
jgi:hypothetical protein